MLYLVYNAINKYSKQIGGKNSALSNATLKLKITRNGSILLNTSVAFRKPIKKQSIAGQALCVALI